MDAYHQATPRYIVGPAVAFRPQTCTTSLLRVGICPSSHFCLRIERCSIDHRDDGITHSHGDTLCTTEFLSGFWQGANIVRCKSLSGDWSMYQKKSSSDAPFSAFGWCFSSSSRPTRFSQYSNHSSESHIPGAIPFHL